MNKPVTGLRSKPFVWLLPVVAGAMLLLWGLKVLFTAFAWGSLPLARWHTELKGLFGPAWLAVFAVVLLPAYLFAIEAGLRSWGAAPAAARTQGHALTALSITLLLLVLTFAARVAVTAWFPSPMHPPFRKWSGGVLPGVVATIVLLALELGVLTAIKYRSRRDQKPYPLLIPAIFGAVLLVWALWVVGTAFSEGLFPVVQWRTEYRGRFGALWLLVTLMVLVPAYLYAMSLGVLGLLRRLSHHEVEQQNLWLVAIGNTALLFGLTFAARVAVTAWFPGPMHPPFDLWQGGVLPGLAASGVLVVLSVFYYRVARAF